MNLEKLKKCFTDALGIDEKLVIDKLKYNSISEWDSVGHMALITEIEKNFNVTLTVEEITSMNSFAEAKIILKKHGITFDE